MKLKKSFCAALVILVGSRLTGAANATDFSDGCCSDLEDRVAELDSTSARKGNRKVSLSVSGYVAQELTWWDDGAERNAYLHGLGPTQATHVKFTGEAQLAAGWSAGYTLRIQNLDDNPFGRSAATGQAIDQFSPDFSQGPNVQMSFWYLQNSTLGKLSIGRQAGAAKSAAMFTDQSGTQIVDNYTFLAGFPQFQLRDDGALIGKGMTWGQLAYCYSQNVPLGGDCDGLVMNSVRYDTPVFRGFSVSASWGEADDWEIAARYTGQWSGTKIVLGAGFSDNTDARISGTAVMVSKDSQFFQAGGYIEHLESGLFLHAAYGHENNNEGLLANGYTAPNSHQWYVKSGIRLRWLPLGATVIYGDYAEYDNQLGPSALAAGAMGSTFARFGGGIAQEVDSAAMVVYLKAQHYEASVSGAADLSDLNGLDLVSVGGLINF